MTDAPTTPQSPPADAERDTFPLRQNRSDLWRMVVQKDRVNDELRSDIITLTDRAEHAEAELNRMRIENVGKEPWAANVRLNDQVASLTVQNKQLTADRDAALARAEHAEADRNYHQAEYAFALGMCEAIGTKSAVYQADRDAALAEVKRLREALERIERWVGEFPETGAFWPSGDPIAYGTQYGSNGERDFMRKIARAALTGTSETQAAGDGE